MSPAPTSPLAALGAAIRARRGELHMSRQAVADAGGPSISTQQRIERGVSTRDIETETRAAYETALQLPAGWITDFLAGRVAADMVGASPDPSVVELTLASGARLLVAVTDGVTRLTPAERRVITALIDALDDEESDQ